MIAHLRGLLLYKSPNYAVVECAGVGYELATSIATYAALPAEGKEVRLHIYTKVAEDQLALYGFAELPEKLVFQKLLSISGIGPRLAITVLSGIAADRLVTAIREGDYASLTKIPGVGKKTAERVVLELKDKLDDLAVTAPAPASPPGYGPAAEDALSALVNLGYGRPIAQKAIETALKNEPAAAADFERLFRLAMTSIR